MSVAGVIDRLDDWINPIVVKELRQAVKSRLVMAMLLLFLGVQLLIVTLFLAFQDMRTNGDPGNSRVGGELFMVLQGILLGTCMVLIPTYASIRMSNERSDANVDLLFISTLRPASIIAGKFFSALVLAMLVFSCCAPFMTFTYLLRGIDIPSILFVLGIDLLAIVLSTQLGLFLASLPATRAFKVFIFFFAFLLVCWAFGGLVAETSNLLREGVASRTEDDFWPIVGVIALAVLFATGLLFCWSVALISPPSANRALMGRLFLVCAWLILGVACLMLSGSFLIPGGHPGPLVMWMGSSVFLFCLQFLISINERDSWGSRVTRAIPRSTLLRGLAFLFYSGSAGGMFLSVICVALTLMSGWSWLAVFPTFSIADRIDTILRVFAAIALYTFCYGLSAVLLRAYLFPDKIRSVYNWVLAALLVGLGSALPWIATLLIYVDQWHRHSDMPWWHLTNPFDAIYAIGKRFDYSRGEFTTVCFVFLAGWAVLLIVLSIPWALQQITSFQPSAPPVRGKASARAEEAEPVMVYPVEAE